jgi:hypothetical protein
MKSVPLWRNFSVTLSGFIGTHKKSGKQQKTMIGLKLLINFLKSSGVTVQYHSEDAKLQLQINKKTISKQQF